MFKYNRGAAHKLAPATKSSYSISLEHKCCNSLRIILGVAYFISEMIKAMITIAKCIYCKLQVLQSALGKIVKLKDKVNVPLF